MDQFIYSIVREHCSNVLHFKNKLQKNVHTDIVMAVAVRKTYYLLCNIKVLPSKWVLE